MRLFLKQPQSRVLAILIVALLVRLPALNSHPIWYDEAFSILFAEKGPSAMLAGTLPAEGSQAAEEHPLGYYTLLWTWIGAFGRSLPAVRSLSLLAGLGVVGLIFLIGRELFTERIGLLGGLFAALAPFQIHYSLEIRMYVFLALWLMLATFALIKAGHTGRWGWWGLFAISAALAEYTHTLAALYLLPLALTPLFRRDRQALKGVFLSGLLALLLYTPWLVHLPAQMAKLSRAYWIEPPGLEKVFSLLLVFTTNLPLPDGWLMPALAIALLAFFLGLWQTLRAFREKQPEVKRGLWLLYLVITPALLSLVISRWQPIFLERSFLPSGAVFCLWLAWALFATGLPRPVQVLVVAGLALGAVIGIYEHYSYAGFPYAPYRELQASLRADSHPGDAIVHSSKLTLLPVRYYDDTLEEIFIADPPGSSVDTLAPATRQMLEVTAKPDIASAAGDAPRLWYIIFQQSIDEYAAAGEETHPDIGWLSEHYSLASVRNFGDLRLYLFTQ